MMILLYIVKFSLFKNKEATYTKNVHMAKVSMINQYKSYIYTINSIIQYILSAAAILLGQWLDSADPYGIVILPY